MIEELELRMYFFTIYQLTGIQAGIQCGHAALEYAYKYGDTVLFKKFMENHKTWIILNGGTTCSNLEFTGSMQEILSSISDFNEQHPKDKINFSIFYEPDLNEAMTAICFICDERVWNYKDYPDFVDYVLNIKMFPEAKEEALKNNPALWANLKIKNVETLQEMFPDYYKDWEQLMTIKNNFLRELLKNKKLA
jgi:hypothetical protein